MNKKLIFLALTLIILFSGLFILYMIPPTVHRDAGELLKNEDFYSTHVQPIFDGKCVACHSCFNSPCQLNLSSYDGVMRGANKISVYDFPKLEARKPTRLYIDAHSKEQWAKLGFYPVTPLLQTLVSDLPGPEAGVQKHFPSEESRICPNSKSEIASFIKSNPGGRMPYGLPALSKEEVRIISQWEKDGALGPDLKSQESKVLNHPHFNTSVLLWEEFFNRTSVQDQISSRYIYEHLFLAHLYFEHQPNVFFRLVRSKSQVGDINEIGASLPFDDPKQKFYYRLRPVLNTLTHKSHIPFPLNSAKMEKWNKDFYKASWPTKPKKMPAYGPAGSNPFTTFADIPVQSRYRFFLDEAGYHVMTFIKGPVCRGPTALNVINDHFWVLFVSPEKDPLSQSQSLYKKIAPHMEMPAEIGDSFDPFISFRQKYWKAVEDKFLHLEKSGPLDETWIWDGDGNKNSNALLTVYRHFDSATVLRGLRGESPKTVWVLDYHVFESIYYNLTAGYNVFGPLLHQLNSRLYMEVSRIASEDLFLSFLPQDQRASVRSSWSTPTPEPKKSTLEKIAEFFVGDVSKKMKFQYHYSGGSVESEVAHSGQEPLIDTLIKKRFSDPRPNSEDDIHPESQSIWSEAFKTAPLAISHLPDTILIKVESFSKSELYTLVHNKAHFNVSMIMFEDERRDPKRDSFDIIKGLATSYANLFMILKEDDVEQWAEELSNSKSKKDIQKWIKKYGLSRSDPEFWKQYEWFSKQNADKQSNESGWLDLNRYIDLL